MGITQAKPCRRSVAAFAALWGLLCYRHAPLKPPTNGRMLILNCERVHMGQKHGQPLRKHYVRSTLDSLSLFYSPSGPDYARHGF